MLPTPPAPRSPATPLVALLVAASAASLAFGATGCGPASDDGEGEARAALDELLKARQGVVEVLGDAQGEVRDADEARRIEDELQSAIERAITMRRRVEEARVSPEVFEALREEYRGRFGELRGALDTEIGLLITQRDAQRVLVDRYATDDPEKSQRHDAKAKHLQRLLDILDAWRAHGQ